MWFEQLFGFEELSYEATKRQFRLEPGKLCSLANGASFVVGDFHTPTLGELRARGRHLVKPGKLEVTHEAIGDVLTLHARPENRGALFQVASQFNCLEFPGPSTVPEDGVSGYANDPTQGPACSLAAAAATVYRNYFVPVRGAEGQTRDNQLNNLDELALAIGEAGQFWKVMNGYTSATAHQLAQLSDLLHKQDRERLLDSVKIGIHRGVGVTFADRFTRPEGSAEPVVSQAFCSAVACAYSELEVDEWEPLATLVLDATYEATLWAAAITAAEGNGSNRVWLTFLGGGVFGNPSPWIVEAIRRALAALDGVDLDVRIAHYGEIDRALERMIDEVR